VTRERFIINALLLTHLVVPKEGL